MAWSNEVPLPPVINETTYKPRYKASFEAPYTSTINKYTKKKKKFELVWSGRNNVITEEHKQILDDFFDENSGNEFEWTNWKDDKTYTVVFSEDEITFNQSETPYHYEVTIMLEEV